jgi:hypothetical protein
MDATEMFLLRHRRLHAHVERLTEDLSESQIRERIHPATNPLAWLLWHIARTEDGAVNLLVFDGRQVLDEAWSARLRAGHERVGTGMSTDEAVELSRKVDLNELLAYWRAVGLRTEELVASLRPPDLDEVVTEDRIRRALERMGAEPIAPLVQQFSRDARRGHFLVWLPLTHNYEHVGQADLVRGILGRPGRF